MPINANTKLAKATTATKINGMISEKKVHAGHVTLIHAHRYRNLLTNGKQSLT